MNDWSFCPRCGSKLAADDGVCTACGAANQSDPHVSTENAASGDDTAVLDQLTAELREALAPKLELLDQLGQGGMGTVFLARDPALKRDVVVKVLSPEHAGDPTARARFAREAEAAAAVSHPNVVGVFQVGDLPASGTSYFVMQWVDGPTLGERFPEGTTVSEVHAKRVIGEVASALAAAHARGLVHRDIKPNNIMIERESGRAVVLDFGISAAKERGDAGQGTALTMEGTSIGTPQYMSPEQAAGEEVSDRSDVYSLGLVAFEVITGSPPFKAGNVMELVAAHIKDIPTQVSELRPDIEPSFAELIDRCLSKEPGERPAAEDLAKALAPQQATLIEWPPPGLEPIRGMARRYLTAITWFAVMELAFILVLGDMALEGAAGEDSTIFIGIQILCGLALLGYVLYISYSAKPLPKLIPRALKAGYPRKIVFDLIIDNTDDTEQLLNRTGPYARLSQVECQQFLKLRRLSFAVTGVLVLATMLPPLFAAPFNMFWMFGVSGIAAVLVIPAGLLVERKEKRFRRRYLKSAQRKAKWTASPEVVETWLKTAGASSPSRSWRSRVFDKLSLSVFDLAVTMVVLAGLLGAVSMISVVAELEEDPPGNFATHFASLDRDRDAARRVRPPLILDSVVSEIASVRPESLWVILSDSSFGDVLSLSAAVDSLDLESPLGSWPESTRATLLEAASYEHLPLWMTLAASDLPALWYRRPIEILKERGEFPERRPVATHAASGENLPLRETWRYVELAAAKAWMHAMQGETREATAVTADMLRVGWNLSRDPLTVAAAYEILRQTRDVLVHLESLTAFRQFAGDTDSLHLFLEDFKAALESYDGIPAVKASVEVADDDTYDALMEFVADSALLPVHRWGLVRGAVLGACYVGDELMFGVSDAREEFLREAMTHLTQLPAAIEYEQFLRELSPHAPSYSGWFWLFGKLLWTIPPIVVCEHYGLLRPAEEEVESTN